jgi:hypothetical protein
MTILGTSFYSALLPISEIWDINRFPDSAHLVSYAGLASSRAHRLLQNSEEKTILKEYIFADQICCWDLW